MGPVIQMIGSPRIVDADGREQVIRGLQPWAVLARVLLSDRPVARRELSSELFPDAADPMGALRWCLAGLRRAVGSSTSFTGDPIEARLPDGAVVDVWSLFADGDLDVDRVGGLLDGVDPKCSPELETWLLVQRERVAGLVDGWLRTEVIAALATGRTSRALELAELAARRAPLDEGAQVLLIKALTAAGRHDAARALVAETHARLRDELGVEPSPALLGASRRHVADPPQGVSSAAVAASLLESGRAAVDAGAVDAGLDCLRRACHEAERSGDRHLEGSCLLELGSALVHAVRSHDDEGALLLRRAADIALVVGDRSVAAAALCELGYVDALAGRRPSAAVHLDRALEAAADDPALAAGARSVRAFNLVDWGRIGEGVDDHACALDLARRSGDRRREAWTLGLGGWALLQSGEATGALTWLRQCVELVDELRWVSFAPWPRLVMAEIDLDRPDRRDEVRSDLDAVFALSCQLSDPCWEGATARVIARACAEMGQGAEALEWITEARERSRRENDTWVATLASILATEAELARRAGDDSRAEAAARDLVSLAARAHMDAHLEAGLSLLGRSGAG